MEAYERAHEQSRFVGLVLSPEALASHHVALERFLAEHRDPSGIRGVLIPILYRPCELPRSLQLRNWVDFRDPTKFEESLERLVATVQGRPLPRVPLGELPQLSETAKATAHTKEVLYSTLLPVTEMPYYVYSAPANVTDVREILRNIRRRTGLGTEVYPWVLSSHSIFTFHDLRNPQGAFSHMIDLGAVERHLSTEMWEDPDHRRLYVRLLNQCLGAIVARRGLKYDKAHRRYYFEPLALGVEREVSYTPLNQNSSTRKVAWQPRSKKDGQPRDFWYHEAVALRFEQLGSRIWCLTIRPELRVTRDGFTPLPPDDIGPKVTRLKSHMYNYDLLGRVNFWRDYLGDGSPRIVATMGGQRLVISTDLLQGTVKWPGIPDDAKPFANVSRQETIFSWAELAATDDVWDVWDELEFDEEEDSDI